MNNIHTPLVWCSWLGSFSPSLSLPSRKHAGRRVSHATVRIALPPVNRVCQPYNSTCCHYSTLSHDAPFLRSPCLPGSLPLAGPRFSFAFRFRFLCHLLILPVGQSFKKDLLYLVLEMIENKNWYNNVTHPWKGIFMLLYQSTVWCMARTGKTSAMGNKGNAADRRSPC